jgi:hypothetical protein
MERRFHSPYRHWLSGFGFELLVFAGTVVVLSLAALLTAWIFG